MAVSFSPEAFCSDCVDRIVTYFEDEEMEIEDIRNLVTLFLKKQKLYFFDHVSIEAFNDRAMKRGGSIYGMPLSLACLRDAVEGGNSFYDKLAGKEVVCAAFSTGLVLQTNNSQTHKQLLEENVDANAIRNGCSCLKSDEWMKDRATVVRKMKKTMETVSWETLMSNKMKNNCWGDDDEPECEATRTEEKEVDDDFRPGNARDVASSCLALCRHDSSCIVNETNKARILQSLIFVNAKNGVTLNFRPDSCLMFSIGATIYEALARKSDAWSDLQQYKANAKVYTTVHTMVAPLSAARTAPVCNLENNYGTYKTFRILGNFSGRYNDMSIGWRSELYPRITASSAIIEGRGEKKLYDSFLHPDRFLPWPKSFPVTVKGGLVYDDSGDASGNYLTNGCVNPPERTVAHAEANVRNRIDALGSKAPACLQKDLETTIVQLTNNLKGFSM